MQMNLRTLIVFFFITLSISIYSQTGLGIFEYEKLKVSQVIIDKTEVYDYKYELGKIIEVYQNLEDTASKVINSYYYLKKDFLDSLVGLTKWSDINEIDIFVRRYCYDNEKLLKSCTLSKVFGKWVCDNLDTLTYSHEENIKELYRYLKIDNFKHDACGCPIISKPKSHANNIKFEYDNSGKIILIKSPFQAIKETRYFYDKGKRSKEVRFHGFEKNGMIQTNNKLYTEIIYTYYSNNLRRKDILKYFKELENGEKKIIYEFETNYEYKFYK